MPGSRARPCARLPPFPSRFGCPRGGRIPDGAVTLPHPRHAVQRAGPGAESALRHPAEVERYRGGTGGAPRSEGSPGADGSVPCRGSRRAASLLLQNADPAALHGELLLQAAAAAPVSPPSAPHPRSHAGRAHTSHFHEETLVHRGLGARLSSDWQYGGGRPRAGRGAAGPSRPPRSASPSLPVCPLLPPLSRLETKVAMCNGYKCTVILLVQYLSDFYLFMMYIYPPSPGPPPSPLPVNSGCNGTLTGGPRLRRPNNARPLWGQPPLYVISVL